MTTRVVWLCVGIILGSLLSTPAAAQVAQRMFGTRSTDLAAGTGTPIVCTASGTGCFLQVQVH